MKANTIDVVELLERLRDADRNSVQRTNGSRIFGEAADTIERLRARAAKYDELIYAVGNVYPNETRHETALRYIRRAEEPNGSQACAAEGK